ncbi:sensor histidine kinase [Shimia ponticola]|uniref:sensor histidine kinase n=1 Tax=Shimia ponticola TaxID=2582893 RepID=UPI0011BEF3EA|nr:HAMP domain-containing sensor histidine kinase [Shimia ponticola]
MNTLSGRFLILTVIFVMLAEVLIFVPSIARFREDYLLARLERAQIASLVLLAENEISPNLESELLENAGVYNVVLRRDEIRQLVLASPIIQPVFDTYDLREPTAYDLISDAIQCLFDTEERVIRVIGNPTRDAGLLIEITLGTQDLRAAMIDYGIRILILSAVISVITAFLLFIAVRRLLVTPIQGVVENMRRYASAPEDARHIIKPKAGVSELRQAEDALYSLQTDLTASLKQKDRLAALGAAVAKVNHDLRNILTSAQLFTDRIEGSEDPLVKRLAPKLVNSITRAVNLCEATLTFGRAEESPPKLGRVQLERIVDDVLDGERLAVTDGELTFEADIPTGMTIRADSEQLYRVLSNLVRNARQALEVTHKPGTVRILAEEDDTAWWVRVSDTGPGMPPKAQEHLFTPFQGGARKGGSGLGLAIAAELIKGHGGKLELEQTGSEGTTFVICLPKSEAAYIPANDARLGVAKPDAAA